MSGAQASCSTLAFRAMAGEVARVEAQSPRCDEPIVLSKLALWELCFPAQTPGGAPGRVPVGLYEIRREGQDFPTAARAPLMPRWLTSAPLRGMLP